MQPTGTSALITNSELPEFPTDSVDSGDLRSYEACDAAALVSLMRSGDRGASAAFLSRYHSRIRRRIRGKLGPPMRRLFDSQEILSTLGRRLDLYVRDGRITAVSENQLWMLLFKMADSVLVDKARLSQRVRTLEGSDGQFAREQMKAWTQAADRNGNPLEIEIDKALRSLDSKTDRQILSLWLNGVRLKIIADHVGLTPEAVRKRWSHIRDFLKQRLVAGSL